MDTTILSVVRFELCNIGLRYIYIYYDNQHALMKKLHYLSSRVFVALNTLLIFYSFQTLFNMANFQLLLPDWTLATHHLERGLSSLQYPMAIFDTYRSQNPP